MLFCPLTVDGCPLFETLVSAAGVSLSKAHDAPQTTDHGQISQFALNAVIPSTHAWCDSLTTSIAISAIQSQMNRL